MTEVIKKILYKGVVPVVGGIMVACMAIANDPESQARLIELKRAREMNDRYSQHDPITTQQVEPDDNQLNNFIAVAQELIDNHWPLTAVSADGIATIQGKDLVLLCGVLARTPSNISDDEYPQFADVSSLEEKLGIETPKTTLIWEGEYTQIDQGLNVTAEMVDTQELVWACKEDNQSN